MHLLSLKLLQTCQPDGKRTNLPVESVLEESTLAFGGCGTELLDFNAVDSVQEGIKVLVCEHAIATKGVEHKR